MLSGKDGMADADSLIEAAETIKQDLQQQAEGTLIKEIKNLGVAVFLISKFSYIKIQAAG